MNSLEKGAGVVRRAVVVPGSLELRFLGWGGPIPTRVLGPQSPGVT